MTEPKLEVVSAPELAPKTVDDMLDTIAERCASLPWDKAAHLEASEAVARGDHATVADTCAAILELARATLRVVSGKRRPRSKTPLWMSDDWWLTEQNVSFARKIFGLSD